MSPSRILSATLTLLAFTLLLLPSKVMALAEFDLEYPVGTAFVDNSTVAFGNVGIGTTSTKILRIRNSGNLVLTVSGWSLTGFSASHYSFSRASSPIAAGSFQDFTISFSPTTSGTKVGKLSITHSDTTGAENPYDINLSGTGTGPDIEVMQSIRNLTSGSTVNFGAIGIGGVALRSFTIRNTGSSPLTSINVQFSGDSDWSRSGVVKTSLAQSESFTIIVQFVPTSIGAASASLSISSSDPDEGSFSITLTGTGVEVGQADLDDLDGDGISNLMEEATGTDKAIPNAPPGILVINGANVEFTYTRSVAAAGTMLLTVETADTPEAFTSAPWVAPAGMAESMVSDGTLDTVTVTYPLPSTPSHFVRLRVTK